MKFQISFFRNDVSVKTLSDKNSVVIDDMVSPWNETILPTLLSNYKLENIFNADEFGLFFNAFQLRPITCPGANTLERKTTWLA